MHKDEPQGLLTGYYEPVLEGSRTRAGHVPDAGLPAPARSRERRRRDASAPPRATASRTCARRRPAPRRIPTRAEIEQGALAGKGLELLYLDDPVDVFFMHIQGSGRIHLTDGTTVRINYDGKNGHPYTSIGRYLIENGLLAANKVSMQSLCKWLRADPDARPAGHVAERSRSSSSASSRATTRRARWARSSVPLTPGRSLAVDTAYHTLGTPLYVSAPTLEATQRRTAASIG